MKRQGTKCGAIRALLVAVVVYLALGAATSVLVAWGLAAHPVGRVGALGSEVSDGELGLLSELRVSTLGALRRAWAYDKWTDPSPWDADIREVMLMTRKSIARMNWESESPKTPSSQRSLFEWQSRQLAAPHPLERTLEDLKGYTCSYTSLSGRDLACGFPFLAVGCTLQNSNGSSPVDLAGGIWVIQPPAPQTFAGALVLPLRPIWSGLAVNTAFYALLWFGMIRIPRALRRHRRMFRGRCPKCGYDLTGVFTAPCSECGWTIPVKIHPKDQTAAP